MRLRGPVTGGLLILLSALPLAAQAPNVPAFKQTFNGVNPVQLNFKPIDTSKAAKTFNVNKPFFKAKTPTAPNLSQYFPSTKPPSNGWPGLVQRPVITGKNNPFQPNPPT